MGMIRRIFKEYHSVFASLVTTPVLQKNSTYGGQCPNAQVIVRFKIRKVKMQASHYFDCLLLLRGNQDNLYMWCFRIRSPATRLLCLSTAIKQPLGRRILSHHTSLAIMFHSHAISRVITHSASSSFGLAILAKDIQAALSQYQQVFMGVHDGFPISYILFSCRTCTISSLGKWYFSF